MGGVAGSEQALVPGGLAIAVVLSLAAFFDTARPLAYRVLGLVFASVDPMGFIWYAVLGPGDGDGLATLILCMTAGGIIGPAIENLMLSPTGIRAVPLVIAVSAVMDPAVFASIPRCDGPGKLRDLVR
jgi:hypothetical protein